MAENDDIAGKVILLTGASAGIGAHLVGVLARRGARVAAAARRADVLRATADALDAAGGTVLPVAMDLGSLASIREGVARVEAELGPVEILVNNAGVTHVSRAVEVAEQDFDRLFDTNVKGTFFLTQICGRRMIDLGIAGRIVTIASVAAAKPMPGLSVYGMSKAALVQMTRALAAEWARHGLSVNAICPGFVATDMNADFFATEAGRRVMDALPKRRITTPEGLEALLLLLISERRSRFVNGAAIAVDDGYSL